jgi:hypothetical protein
MRSSRATTLAAGLALLAGGGPVPTAAAAGLTPAPASASQTWVWPLEPVPAVERGFELPEHPWGAGHRGVDLLGSSAQPVLAIGAGTVSFAGPLATRGVVVIDHGELRSTYEPVTAAVHRGEHVAAGQVVGLLQTPNSHCPPQVCLHLGLRRGSSYLDPLDLLGPRPVRLKPLSASDGKAPPQRAGPAPLSAPVGNPLDVRKPRASSSGPAVGHDGRARAAVTRVVVAILFVVSALIGRSQARG